MTLATKVDLQLARIKAQNPILQSVITPLDEAARACAAKIDAQGNAGKTVRPLSGMTVSIKDNIDLAGVRSTAGSAFFSDRIANSDAVVAARLRRAGATLIAKVNLHEFAFGGTTQNPHHGSCRNPWNTDAIPGGSSGGSGSSVASGFCDVSLGTDTGGSIRIPAALNGVVGLRPTVGRVSSVGSVPVSAIFDTIGPLAHTAAAAAAVFEAIAGYDPDDELSVDVPVASWASARARGIEGLRMGIAEGFFFDALDPDVEEAVRAAITVLETLGLQRETIEIPGIARVHQLMSQVLLCDAASFHRERLEQSPDTFGADVLERMLIGYNTSGIDHAQGMIAQRHWRRQIERMFQTLDLVVTPTVGFGAPLVADSRGMIEATRGLTRLTFPWSFAQVPALSVPCGFTREGMPIGMQLVGKHFDEARLLAVADAFQQITDFHRRRPSLWIENS